MKIPTEAGEFAVHVSEPQQPGERAVVVLQEIFGVTRKIRGYCDLIAAAGYVAAAPDLFWRQAPGVELSHAPEDMQRAMRLLAGFDETKGLADIAACAAALRARGMRRIAVLGFCLGGKLAALAAASGLFDAAVSFYGVGLETRLDALARGCPTQLHFGANDEYVPAAARTAIAGALAARTDVETHVYAGAGHAFFRPDLKDDASPVAWQRTKAFLAAHLSA